MLVKSQQRRMQTRHLATWESNVRIHWDVVHIVNRRYTNLIEGHFTICITPIKKVCRVSVGKLYAHKMAIEHKYFDAFLYFNDF